jgi:hypothetical protein
MTKQPIKLTKRGENVLLTLGSFGLLAFLLLAMAVAGWIETGGN